jgi:hypothetical protein
MVGANTWKTRKEISMKKIGSVGMMLALAVIGLVISACSIQVDRNADGTLAVEAVLPEASVQQEIEAGLNDPLIVALHAELHDGYVQVSGERARPLDGGNDEFAFELRLSAQEGHLACVLSAVTIDGRAVDKELVAAWNERLANRLARAGQRSPNASLQSVSISEHALTFVWHVETPRSREG